MKNRQDETNLSEQIRQMIEADKFATEMDDILLDISDLNPELCPPDRRYTMPGREAWVYEHGNICELVFVKSN